MARGRGRAAGAPPSAALTPLTPPVPRAHLPGVRPQARGPRLADGGMLVTRLDSTLSYYYSHVTKSHVTRYFGRISEAGVYKCGLRYKTEPADRAARRDERRTHGSGLG